MSVQEWIMQWISLRCAGLSARTVAQYNDLVRRFVGPTLGKTPITELMSADVAKLLQSICDTGHTRTAELVYVLLNAALRAAYQHHIINQNPCDLILRPRHYARQTQFLPPEELHRFAMWCLRHPSTWSTAWLLAMICGLRRGELCGLRWSDVDLRQGEIHICNQRQVIPGRGTVEAVPKSRSSVRTIPLPAELVRVLRAQLARQTETRLKTGIDTPYVVSGANNRPVCPHTLDNVLPSSLAAAGVPRITLHGLRHSMATAGLSAEVPMRVLQQLLGHASMSTTARIYTHVLHKDEVSAIDAIRTLVL